jgi:hypothetical protein
MKEHFVTLFNNKFLPQGLSLYASMVNNIEYFNLWVICLDSDTYEILDKLKLNSLTPLRLADFETEELLAVKEIRTFAEYCWTLTPFSFKFVYQKDNSIRRLTYLDADFFFFDNPKKIFSDFELSKKAVLITKHNYSPFYDHSKTSGKFCVQFLTIDFKDGELIRKDWEEKCIEWCYNRFEEGKFGDQKYLDLWPINFDELVYIVKDKELFLAPWNCIQYSIDEIIAFHFHGLRIISKSHFNIGNYLVPKSTFKYIYLPYIDSLKKSIEILEKLGFNNYVQQKKSWSVMLESALSVPYFIIKLFKYRHIIRK